MQKTEIINKQKNKTVILYDEMSSSYLSYAMSVIISRALPDVRDGLKPVHRRIIYAMYKGGFDWSKTFRKSARIVGDVMGKYHPHGDQAIYDALVRMVQDFSMSLPLIDGQGNFGSVDGDAPAAMRYTETKLAKVAQHLINDIEKNTVVFKSNYDETDKEPTVLPSQFPNLLVNGAGGIAVGMATSIPSHNLGEVIDGTLALINNKEIEISDQIATILDMSHAFTGIEITGDNSSLFLNRHLPIDLRSKNFPDLSSASSAIHHVSVKLFKITSNSYCLYIPRGFALSIWEILLETADQFGYEVLER